MRIRTIQTGDGPLLKELTLRSVAEAPYAFGATLEDALSADAASFDAVAAEHAVSAAISRLPYLTTILHRSS